MMRKVKLPVDVQVKFQSAAEATFLQNVTKTYLDTKTDMP